MDDTPARVDHVGIAVESVEVAEPVLEALGCRKLAADVAPDGSFRWVYYELGDASRIELVESLEEETFVTRFLDEYGPGLHHVTLEVADIDAVVETLEASGLRVVDYAAHDGWTEAFVSPRNPTGALFQLMEYDEDYAEERGESLYVGGEPVGAGDG